MNKKLPPLPKFQTNTVPNKVKDSQMEQKITNFLQEIEQKPSILIPSSQPQHIQANSDPVIKPADKKKLTLANINSKLNNMLTSKKININAISTPTATNLTNNNSISVSNSIDLQKQKVKNAEVQYDPYCPNNYELCKVNYLKLINSLANEQETTQLEQQINEKQKQVEEMIDEKEASELVEQQAEQLEEKEQIALRMMQKYGYKVGEGLGKQSQGIKTPLIVKKTTDSSGIIQQSSISLNQLIKPETSAKNALSAHNILPTEVIVFIDLLKLENLSQEIEQQLREQCSLMGDVKSEVTYLHQGCQLRIFIQYESKEEALTAFIKMNNKYFRQELASIRFYSKQLFQQGLLGEPLHQHIII